MIKNGSQKYFPSFIFRFLVVLVVCLSKIIEVAKGYTSCTQLSGQGCSNCINAYISSAGYICYWCKSLSASTCSSFNDPGCSKSCSASAPSYSPSIAQRKSPSTIPTYSRSLAPTCRTSHAPTYRPSTTPTYSKSTTPTFVPTYSKSKAPTSLLSVIPTFLPSTAPTSCRTSNPPTYLPSTTPSSTRSNFPTTITASFGPTTASSLTVPTYRISHAPTNLPSTSKTPTYVPSIAPSFSPSTYRPSYSLTLQPTFKPTSGYPTLAPTHRPSGYPSRAPTYTPSYHPTFSPTSTPSCSPSSSVPTCSPTSGSPTLAPTYRPSACPSRNPTYSPSQHPTFTPSSTPTVSPSSVPTHSPTHVPSGSPSSVPTNRPTFIPTVTPSLAPSYRPSFEPTTTPTAAPTFCPLGYFLESENAITCTACPINTYGESNNNICINCPAGFVTGNVASTGKDSCISPATNFVLGILSLVVCTIIAWIYIIKGRLQLIAFERRIWIVEKSIMVYGSLNDVISLTKTFCRDKCAVLGQISLEEDTKILKEAEETGVYTYIYYKVRAKNILRPILFVVVAFILGVIVVVGSGILATSRVLFNAVLLYRGYKIYLKHDFVFLNRTQLFLQEVFLGCNIDAIVYPISYFINLLSNITVDLSNVGISCVGSQAPAYLLVDFLITAVVVLNISSNVNIFWFTMVTECTSEFGKLLTNHFYLRQGVCKSLSTLMYMLVAFALSIFPSPMKINQYLLSFVYMSVFFSNNGVSSSSQNCDESIGFPLDSVEAVLTSLLVMFLVLPMVYMFGQVLYPKPFAHDNIGDDHIVDDASLKLDGTNSFARRVFLFLESLGIDYELIWGYLSSCISFDWLFLKLLVVYAQSLENNLQAFLSSTFTNLTDLKNAPLTAAQGHGTEEPSAYSHQSSFSSHYISWLYFEDYRRIEYSDELELKAREVDDFQKQNPTFMLMQLRIWKDLCCHTEHIPTAIMNVDDATTRELSCSSESREIWKFVAMNYIRFCCMSVGYWTEVMVQELSIIDNFERFHGFAKGNTNSGGGEVNESSKLKLGYNPLRMKDDATEVYVEGSPGDGEIDSAEDIERKGLFVKYLSSMTSCRSVLWQLIPGMTAFAILSVDLSACPVFIFSSSIEENQLLPPLLVLNSWSIAESQIQDYGLGGKSNKKPYYWQLALLSYYIFMQESRVIQFTVVVANNLTAFAIVFGSSNLAVFVILFLAVNLLMGLSQFAYTVLLLHQFFFAKDKASNDDDNKKDKDDENNGITEPFLN
eukprot:gene21994-28470_t